MPDCKALNLFNCPNTTKCIHKDWFCDGENDCWDFSDEQNCAKKFCDINKFECRNGNCISFDQVCDGKNNCNDTIGNSKFSSDEQNCSKLFSIKLNK